MPRKPIRGTRHLGLDRIVHYVEVPQAAIDEAVHWPWAVLLEEARSRGWREVHSSDSVPPCPKGHALLREASPGATFLTGMSVLTVQQW